METAFPEYMTIKETAELLRVSTRTVRRLMHQGELDYRRVGYRTVRIATTAVREYIERQDQAVA